MLMSKSPNDSALNEKGKVTFVGGLRLGRLLRKPPRLPPRLSPDEGQLRGSSTNGSNYDPKWAARQQSVKDAFEYAWSGYRKFAMGYDELMPISQRGVDGLGGLGATVVDALDTAMIMGHDSIVSEAGSWVEAHLLERISQKGQVNVFETTIRVLGGLLSAYHLSGGEQGTMNMTHNGPKPAIFLNIAKDLADRLLSAFNSSPTPVPYSDVILRDSTAHPAPGGMSSTAEVALYSLNSITSVLFLVIQSIVQRP